jgi:hypothetical protein
MLRTGEATAEATHAVWFQNADMHLCLLLPLPLLLLAAGCISTLSAKVL